MRFKDGRDALDRLLDHDTPEPPTYGFDTRFFARLESLKKEMTRQRWPWLRWAIGGLGAIGAAVALVLVLRVSPNTSLEADLSLAMDLEIVEELPLIQQLDEVEAYEVLARLDVAEIDSLSKEVPQ